MKTHINDLICFGGSKKEVKKKTAQSCGKLATALLLPQDLRG